MRRLSVFLMIAVLLAAFIPSTALAGKTGPTIANMMVYSYGDDPYQSDPNLCHVWVRAVLDGRAYKAEFTQFRDGNPNDTATVLVDNKNHWAYTFFYSVELGSGEYTWKIQLRDRKGIAIGALVPTGPEGFTGEGCPPVVTPGTNPTIATYFGG